MLAQCSHVLIGHQSIVSQDVHLTWLQGLLQLACGHLIQHFLLQSEQGSLRLWQGLLHGCRQTSNARQLCLHLACCLGSAGIAATALADLPNLAAVSVTCMQAPHEAEHSCPHDRGSLHAKPHAVGSAFVYSKSNPSVR